MVGKLEAMIGDVGLDIAGVRARLGDSPCAWGFIYTLELTRMDDLSQMLRLCSGYGSGDRSENGPPRVVGCIRSWFLLNNVYPLG